MDAENSIDGHGFVQGAAAPAHAARIGIDDEHACGRVTLSDAAAGNVPDAETYRRLQASFSRWGRAPITYCVTIRSTLPGLFATGYGAPPALSDATAARARLRDSYALTWVLDCFTKPTVSLIDGAVNGAGVGLSLYGTHRVAGAGYRFSVPGPSIGWFPDHGVAHVFSRLPDAIGTYLALTGDGIGRADAYRLGLLSQCIDADRFDAISRCLADADPVDPLLDDQHVEQGIGELEPMREAIARCFSAQEVDAIVARLLAETGVHADWARRTAADLRKTDPLALAITLRLLREARTLDLRETLLHDYRIASRLLSARSSGAGPPATDERALAALFAPLEDELPLLSRSQMQATGP